MRANSASSLFVSLVLHASLIAVIFFTTVFFAKRDEKQPHIIELVAGPGDDPGALEAPDGGGKIKVDIPKIEPPPPEPEAPPEENLPTAQPSPAAPPKTPPKPKTKENTAMLREMKQNARMSYRDYMKKHPTPKPAPETAAPRTAANVPRIDSQGIANGVRNPGSKSTRGSGGKALTREEADELDTYISMLRQELKHAYEPPPGVNDQLEATVVFDITASGAILNPRISKSSGNREFDEAVLEAFRRVRSIGPLPTRQSESGWTINFRGQDQE